MNSKYFVLFASIFLVFLASNTFAAVTVSDVNISCSPSAIPDANCYTNSDINISWKVIDTNEEAARDWNYQICYVVNLGQANCLTHSSVADGNLQSICGADEFRKDHNFSVGRNCSYNINIGGLTNQNAGEYDYNINIAGYIGTEINGSGSNNINAGVILRLSQKVIQDTGVAGAKTIEDLASFVPLFLVLFIVVIVIGLFVGHQQGLFSIEDNVELVIGLIFGIVVAIVVLLLILFLASGLFASVA